MRRLVACALGIIVAVLLALDSRAEQPSTLHGEISDSQCALNVHSLTKSHEEMLKSKSGAAGNTPASCSVYCVAYLGGNFVLTSKGHVYHLDNQDLARRFVGSKVVLHGIPDPKNEAIHVLGIEAE